MDIIPKAAYVTLTIVYFMNDCYPCFYFFILFLYYYFWIIYYL